MHMKKWLIRAVLMTVILEVIYLAVINLALNLPYTQTLINQIKPDKFAVYWDSAWSLYPFRVHARGISANGQSSSQQWQIDSIAASASISILPLIGRSVNVHDLEVENIEYQQRPRPKPGKDVANIHQYFPVIRGRKPEDAYIPISKAEKPGESPAATAPKKKGGSWKINLTDAHARGNHRIWIYQAKGIFQGEVQTDLALQTRGGPLALRNGGVDLKLDSLVINGDREVASRGHLKGSVEMAPFVPSENKGIKALKFLKAALNIETKTESLAFLNPYLRGLHGMKVDGAGKSSGHIAIRNGKLQPGTNLAVVARKLGMDLLSYRGEGAGNIRLSVKPDTPNSADVAIEFGKLEAFHAESEEPLLTGEGLSVTGRGGTTLVRTDGEALNASYLAVTIPSVKVPDLKIYQRYLPDRLALTLHGGQGELQGKTEISPTGFNTGMTLVSKNADVGLGDYRFTTDLDMAVKADCPSIGSAGIDIAGTYIRLNDAKLSGLEQEKSEPWNASLAIEKGVLKLHLPEEIPKDADIRQLWAAIDGKDVIALLETGEEALKLSGKISDLRWLNLLLKNPYNMAIDGAGEISADLNIVSGWPAPGTLLKVDPQELTVNVLDYVATGGGLVTLEVEKGGQHPDLNLNVEVDDALFRRRGEKKAFIENVAIELQVLGRGMSYDGPGGDVELNLRIPSATVTDMSVYNRYLPRQSPFAFTGGKADLTADINLKPKSAGGFVKLKTTGMQSRIDEQHISGELTADIKLGGGVPQNMDFDISGSSLVLDGVRIAGEQKTFDQADWYARFDLKKGRAIWKKPMRIEVQAGIEMKDTRPMVAIMSNQRGKHGWLEKILTVEDVKGEARMSMAQDQIVIPLAFAGSDDIDVGAKGIINAETRDGVFYVRFKKLYGILKVRGDDRNFDILNARKKFDEYSPDPVKLN
jgi:hypothetical protein